MTVLETTLRTVPTTVESIRAADIRVDQYVQRRLRPAWVKNTAPVFNLDGIGMFHVSKREDGHYYAFDGQHRREVLLFLDMGDWEVDCLVYHGLTPEEECARFRLLNRSQKVSAFEDFDKGVKAGDPECVAINTLVENAGLFVSEQKAPGCVRAVNVLRKLYSKENGPAALIATLSVMTEAWGTDADALDGQIIAGIGEVLLRYGGEVDLGVLAKKLSKRTGGPYALIGDAKQIAGLRRTTVGRGMAEVLVAEYNVKRRVGRLGAL